MRKIVPSLAILLAMTGCRTPVFLGGDFSHREVPVAATVPYENLIHRERWVFFWGLAGMDEIGVPDMGGGFDMQKELADKFTGDERLVDLVVEEGTTIPGIITSFFTIGIVSQRDVLVKARRVTRSGEPRHSTSGSP